MANPEIDALRAEDPRALLTVAETCALLLAGRTKVNELISVGHLQSYRDSNRRRIFASSVYAYMDKLYQLELQRRQGI